MAAILAPGSSEASQEGPELFRDNCAPCHSLGSDRILGPGLAGVTERREHDWLVRKITEPERLVREGDPITLALIDEYDMAMVGLGISPEQAEAVLVYLAGAAEVADAPDAREEPVFTADQAELGRQLFDGGRRLANRAANCNACHDVSREGVIGGGSLAADLTDAYSRMGPDALVALVRNPPFPVMRRAYEDRPVTDEEALALAAFLRAAEAEAGPRDRNGYGVLLAGAGALGTLLLAGIFTMAWQGRRRGSVNREIFDRQVRSR